MKVSLIFCCLLGLAGAVAGGEEDARLERFLQRLGLVELQTYHLERQLDSQSTDRLAIARRLADLYAGQLVETLEDANQYDQMMKRINRLLEKVPQAKTVSLEVMLLQAEYSRAEKLVGRWIADRQANASRQQAAEVLQRIGPQLEQHQRRLSAQVTRLTDQVDQAEDQQEQEIKSRELRRVRAIAGRAGYFAAWSAYYQALVAQQSPSAQGGFTKARKLFQNLLGIGDQYDEIQAEFLALQSVWRSRALIGLALAEASVGNPSGSDLCFSWLDHGSVPLSIKEQVPFWRLQALLNAKRYADALQFARQQVESFSRSNSPSKFSFCVSLVRAGFGGSLPPGFEELGMLGIAGLAKIGRYRAVQQLMKEYGIEPQEDAGFYLHWIKGQQLFERAESGGGQSLYQDAAEVLQQALAAPDAKRDLGAAAQCRSQLAWCNYRLGEYERAARQFEQASIGLKAARDRTAVQSAWMAFISYRKLIDGDNRRFVSAAIAVLKQLQRDFPEDDYAKQAAFHITKLQQGASTTAETLADLEKVRPGAANYLAARYDICLMLHKQAVTAQPDQRTAARERLVAATDTYLRAARRDSDNRRKTKCCLLVADAALKEPVDLSTASRFLDKARPFADRLAERHPTAAEFHYQALLLARKTGNQDRQQKHIDWLVENAQKTPYEVLALGLAAQSIDREIRSLKAGVARRGLMARAYEIYGRLSDAIGDSSEQIKSKKNARVALSKRARYASLLGRPAEAAEILEQLLVVFSKDKSYIRRAGLAHYQARDYQRSVGHWRTLLSGLPKASDEWFEAKYYQLSCLSHLDHSKFRQVFQQFELLYPDGGSPQWRDRFKELRKK